MKSHVALRRLYNQHLGSPPLATAQDVVRALGAVQSQDYGSAKWGVARRTESLTDPDVERAVDSGAILRTHVLRPTWHFVLREDARWMLGLTAPRIRMSMSYHDRELGLDRVVVRRSHAVLERALRDGQQLTRAELAELFRRARVAAPTGQHVGHLLMRAELDRVIISGARRGKQATYALFDDRVPPAPERERDESLQDLARRYFATRGPATLQDFAWWSGLTQADGRRGLEALGMMPTVVNGRTYYGHAAQVAEKPPRVDLVQIYDEIGVAYTESRDVVQGDDILLGRGPVYYHSILLNGKLIGRWRRTVEAGSVSLETQFRRALTKGETKALERELERYRLFATT